MIKAVFGNIGLGLNKELVAVLLGLVCAAAFAIHPVAGVAAVVAPVIFLIAIQRTMMTWRVMMVFMLFASSYFSPSLSALAVLFFVLAFLSGVSLSIIQEQRALYFYDRRLWFAIGGFFLWSILSAIQGVDPATSVKEVVRYSMSFLVLFTYLNWLRRFDQIKTTIEWCELLAVAIAIVCSIEAVSWLIHGVAIDSMADDPVSLIKGPYAPTFSELGAVMAGMLPVSVSLLFTSTLKKSLPRLIGVVVLFLGVLFSSSRASAIGAVCGVACVFFFLAGKNLRRILILGAMSLFAFGFYVLARRYGDIGTGIVHNLSGRDLIWRAALQAMTENPLFGVGPGGWHLWFSSHYGAFDFVIDDLKGNTFVLNPGTLGGEAHSLFFTKAAEMGAPSLIWMALLFIVWAVGAFSMIRKLPQSWIQRAVTGCACGMIALFVRCFFESGPIIGRGRGLEIIFVWFLAALPLVVPKILQGKLQESELKLIQSSPKRSS